MQKIRLVFILFIFFVNYEISSFQPSEFERDTKVEEEEDPAVIALMEKIKPAPGYDKKRNYSEIVVGAESFLLSLDKKTRIYLDTKPSCLDGLTSEEEEDLRYLGAEIIETMVYLLKLPMIVGETACIFFQRFYGIQSFVRHPFEVSFLVCFIFI